MHDVFSWSMNSNSIRIHIRLNRREFEMYLFPHAWYLRKTENTRKVWNSVLGDILESSRGIICRPSVRRLFVTCDVFARYFFVAFSWLFRAFSWHLSAWKNSVWVFFVAFRGFSVAFSWPLILGKIYAYSPWNSLLTQRDLLGNFRDFRPGECCKRRLRLQSLTIFACGLRPRSWLWSSRACLPGGRRPGQRSCTRCLCVKEAMDVWY